jgi:hypothetical protein
MKMKALYAALSGAILLSAATLSPAATDTSTPPSKTKEAVTHPVESAKYGATTQGGMSRDQYKSEKDKIEADYKAANDNCKGMSGNAKDVCHKQAKGDEKVAKAELEAKYKGTSEAQYELAKTKAKAARDVAEEKCDDMKGKDKSACKKQAKADEAKALADAKALKGKQVATAPAPTTAPRDTTPPARTNPPSTTSK